MGMSLAIVPEKTVKSLIHGIAFRSGPTESPFSKSAGYVSFLFENLGHGYFIQGNGPLSFRFELSIVSNVSMSGMFSRH